MRNDNNPDGGPLTVALVGSSDMHGSFLLAASGAFYYKPDAGFVGKVAFTYQLRNAAGVPSKTSAKVTLTVA